MKRRGREKLLQEMAREHNLLSCVQCGKCSSVCTMAGVFPDFKYEWAPRAVIYDVLVGRDPLVRGTFWFCLTCEVCKVTCPSGVRFKDLVEALRRAAASEHVSDRYGRCRICGKILLPEHTLRHVSRAVGRYEIDPALLCERCKRRIIVRWFKGDSKPDRKAETIWPRSGPGKSRKKSARTVS